MTTPAQTTLLHASELLEERAKALREACNVITSSPTWEDADEEHAIYDDILCTVLELRLLAKHINGGQIAVSPAPIFERKENG
jgi:hypothetical protein